MRAAQSAQLRERYHLRVGEAAQTLHVEHDDLAQARRALARSQDLVELLLVLHEQIFGIAVVDQVLDLRRQIGRIDAGRHARRAQRRGRRTAIPCCCPRGWRRARPAAARARSAPSRRPWPPRRTGPRCRPSVRRSFSRIATLSPRLVTRCQNRASTVSKPSRWIGCVICTFMCHYLALKRESPPPCGGGLGRGDCASYRRSGFPHPWPSPRRVEAAFGMMGGTLSSLAPCSSHRHRQRGALPALLAAPPFPSPR